MIRKRQRNTCVNERLDLARRIYEAAHIVGSFKLRSGITSHEYFDKYRFESDPDLLFKVTFALKDLVPADVELLASLELGGIPIATLLGQLTRLPVVFVRKRAKDYGTCRQAEGADISRKRIVVIEDIITSGGQILESVESLRALGAVVDGNAGARRSAILARPS